ncbi:ribose-5-phosphate isomerase RpiA [Pedobacter sp. LMG 31464]|uniref:Ribose-5-phosphate isomerase A n=1 Tax=Pedobacter planticolens TaxID=2679964 RepID=A0A923IUI1_9SPHI|nr:ribose-5-phosphate isomerase RpiA [Pedobacter planticolens]MBB2144194.1 ribose-5-phosphate isomerase RpiA [Pedobacter planticolens]
MANDNQNLEKLTAAKAAIAFVKNNDVVGLGTGSTATLAIKELAKLIKDGLKITGVPSSEATKKLAISLGIPLLELGKVRSIDVSIDGADEFTKELNLIKGGGGALFREKIMASLSKKTIIVTDGSKLVEKLGAFKVPIEVNPNAEKYVMIKLKKLKGKPVKRIENGKIFITDNQNYIFDTDFGLIDDPEKLAYELNQIDGVLGHGIFVNLTDIIFMAKGDYITSYHKNIG